MCFQARKQNGCFQTECKTKDENSAISHENPYTSLSLLWYQVNLHVVINDIQIFIDNRHDDIFAQLLNIYITFTVVQQQQKYNSELFCISLVYP